MISVGDRLRKFGLNKFQNMKAFANALGMQQSNLSAYLSGLRTPGNKMRKRLAELGADIDWIMTGIIPNTSESNLRPVYANVPAGKGSIVKEAPPLMEEAPPNVQDNGKGYWLRVKGNSMFPAMREGQLVFVNPEKEVRDKDFAVVIWHDHTDGAIKQVHFTDESVILTSINPAFEPITIPRKNISMIARICFIKL